VFKGRGKMGLLELEEDMASLIWPKTRVLTGMMVCKELNRLLWNMLDSDRNSLIRVELRVKKHVPARMLEAIDLAKFRSGMVEMTLTEGSQLKPALAAIARASDKGLRHLVLDLDNNPSTADLIRIESEGGEEWAKWIAEYARIADLGGVSAVLEMMQMHKSSPVLCENACRILVFLARNFDNQKLIAEAGGINLVVDVMKLHLEDAQVQERGCAALSNLACNAQNETRILEGGVISVILTSMRKHRLASVSEWACRALRNIACYSDNPLRIAQEGGIETILNLMQQHRESAGLQEEACAVLHNLALEPESNSAIAAAGGIESIIKGMKEHLTSMQVQQEGCAALQVFSERQSYHRRIVRAGGVQILSEIVRIHNHPRVTNPAYSCLSLLSSHSFLSLSSSVV